MQTRDDVRFLKPLPQVWADTLCVLSEHLSPGKLAFLQNANLVQLNKGVATLAFFNSFAIAMASPYESLVRDALSLVTGIAITIEYLADSVASNSDYTGTLASIEPVEQDAEGKSQTAAGHSLAAAGAVSPSEIVSALPRPFRAAGQISQPEIVASAGQNDPSRRRTPITPIGQCLPDEAGKTSATASALIDGFDDVTLPAVHDSSSDPVNPRALTSGQDGHCSVTTSYTRDAIGRVDRQAARSSSNPPVGRIGQTHISGVPVKPDISSGRSSAQALPSNRKTAAYTPGRYSAQPPGARSPVSDIQSRAGLNQKYTFSNFVVGSSNRFCHSAALAISQNPGANYNPLFIYGGVGLGKTHLMQAIGHAILNRTPDLLVRYLSCERFTNELINSIKDKQMVEFRKRYRYVDVLLIDDIQFIEGKESTQEEFFHTFNALKEIGKQIVLSSDRPPRALSRLEERLQSRFESGLMSDMQAPDYEMRLAILRKRCESDGIRLDDAILSQIATIFSTNIRELEGALIRVAAYANFTGEPLDQISLHNLLTPSGTPKLRPSLSVEEVIRAVAEFYKIEPAEIKAARRSQDLAMPRHIAMHLAHELINLSFPRIGQAFGNRKHTSVLYAHNKVRELAGKDANVASAIAQIRRQLGH